MTHTVIGYGQKHRKCKDGKFVSYPTLPPNCIDSGAFCLAKLKIVNDELPRPFCKLFRVRKRSDNNA